jgi:hypothetical protein
MPSVSIRSLAGCITNTASRPLIRDEIFADHSGIVENVSWLAKAVIYDGFRDTFSENRIETSESIEHSLANHCFRGELSSHNNPCNKSVGVGGQPRITRSTGITFETAPTHA